MNYSLSRVDIFHIRDALENAIAELETLETGEAWFASDSLSSLYSALEITISTINGKQ